LGIITATRSPLQLEGVLQIGRKLLGQRLQLAIAQDLVHIGHGRAVTELVNAAIKHFDNRLELIDVDFMCYPGW
jgi:hypothetical protein